MRSILLSEKTCPKLAHTLAYVHTVISLVHLETFKCCQVLQMLGVFHLLSKGLTSYTNKPDCVVQMKGGMENCCYCMGKIIVFYFSLPFNSTNHILGLYIPLPLPLSPMILKLDHVFLWRSSLSWNMPVLLPA